jgi:hypothetical protein
MFFMSTTTVAAPCVTKIGGVVATSPEVQVVWDQIDKIDFSNIKRRLMLPAPEGDAFDEHAADLSIEWYRRYLKLHAKYQEYRLVPSRFIDIAWHRHILDTRAYLRDCVNCFGEMLHHNPYFGMNDDAAERDAAFEVTDRLYVIEFGESCRVASQIISLGAMCSACDDGGACTHN